MAWTSQAPGCTIDGLSLTGFGGAAIVLEPATQHVGGSLGNTVWGNFIGVTQFNPQSFNPVNPGNNPYANGVGILIDGPNNLIGGTSPADRNVIQGNTGDGVIVYGSQGTGNTIATNFILDNGGDGVLMLSAEQPCRPGERARDSPAQGTSSRATWETASTSSARRRRATRSSTTRSAPRSAWPADHPDPGDQARANGGDGVLIENAPANVIGGQITDSGNVIAGNSGDGVGIENYVNGTIPDHRHPAADEYAAPPPRTGNIVAGEPHRIQ